MEVGESSKSSRSVKNCVEMRPSSNIILKDGFYSSHTLEHPPKSDRHHPQAKSYEAVQYENPFKTTCGLEVDGECIVLEER